MVRSGCYLRPDQFLDHLTVIIIEHEIRHHTLSREGDSREKQAPALQHPNCYKFQVSPLPKQGLAPEEQAPRHRSILIAKRLLCRELTRPIPPFLMVAQPYFPPLVLDRAIISEQQNVQIFVANYVDFISIVVTK